MDLARIRTKGHYIIIGMLILHAAVLALSEDTSDAVQPVDQDINMLFDPAMVHSDVQPDMLKEPSPDASHARTSKSANNEPAPLPSEHKGTSAENLTSSVFAAAVISLCVVGCVAFVGGMYCWYKVLIHNDYQPMGDGAEINHKGVTNNNLAKLAEKTDYPAYGVTGPNPLHRANKGPPIDLTLNRNAEQYHFHQQKQRLKKMNSVSSNGSSHSKHSTPDSPHDHTNTDATQGDEENSDGEYTVYACPGLASASDGPMEIENPLFGSSDSNVSSYSSSTIGGNIVTAKLDFSTTVGGR